MFNKQNREYTEDYLKSRSKTTNRYWILIFILFSMMYIVNLAFAAGLLSGSKFQEFYAIANLVASGLLSIVTAIISFYYGVEVGKKSENKIEEIKKN